MASPGPPMGSTLFSSAGSRTHSAMYLARSRSGDGFAARQLAVAEHDVGPTLLHGLHLAGEGLEEGGGADDGIGDVAGGGELLLELELGGLEGEEGLLDADGGKEHEVLRAALAGDVEDVLGSLVVDVPRVLDAAGARGEAGDHDVEASAVEGVVADGVDGRHRAELDGGVGEERARLSLALLTTDAGLVADERGDIVALRAELADDELADVAGAAHDQHLRGGVLLGNVRDGGSDGEHAARGLGAGALRAAEGRGAGAIAPRAARTRTS